MELSNNTVDFKCNVWDAFIPFPHFWEHTVGSCHATMALRADWQQQLLRCHKELGFKHVRFHGILSDDMGTLVCENDQFVFSFFNTDQVFDFLLSIGMRPFVELSFMPTILSSGNDTVFHYKGNVTPPRNYDDWATLIYKLVTHWVDRYGLDEVSQWFFEIWNEPSLNAFWKGSKEEYFKLYRYTAAAIKKVSHLLKVGGPATADNAWIVDIVDFCAGNKVPLDFISTHHYPTDSFGQPGDDTVAQLAASRRSVLRDMARTVKEEAGGKPVYYTEWCTSSNPFDEMHDMPYAAAFIIKTVMEATGLVAGYSYWTFSDLFEENYFSSVPFHGGFGLLNIYSIAKPAYRAFELLHGLGNELLPVEGRHETADVWIVREKETLKIMITNWALPRHNIKTETITIQLENTGSIRSAYIERIDESNANAYNAWINMSRPDSLSQDAVKELSVISSLVKQPIQIHNKHNMAYIEVVMPPQSSACITLATQ